MTATNTPADGSSDRPAEAAAKQHAARGASASGAANSKSGASKASSAKPRTRAASKTKSTRKAPARKRSPSKAPAAQSARSQSVGDGLANLAEDLVNRLIKRLDLVLLTRERIQATLDEAVERGRVTRSDANELAAELFRRGRQQTDDVLSELEGFLGRGREQFGSATRRARQAPGVDRLARSADRARRTVGLAPTLPISNYDELTVAQVDSKLTDLTAPQLRRIRDYERTHANRKSVLAKIETLLD